MGGSPNPLVQHLAGETSLLGTTGFQPWLPGPSVIMREGVTVMAAPIIMTIYPINIGLKSKSFGMPMEPQYVKSFSRPSQWPSNRMRAHILESRKNVMSATVFGKGTSLLGMTRSSTIVARAPCFQEVANINCELLHEAVCGHFPSTHRQRESWSKATANNSHRYDWINTLEHHLLDCVMVDIAAGWYHPFESTRQKTCLHV